MNEFGTGNSQNGITSISADTNGFYVAGFVGYNDVTPVPQSYVFLRRYDLWANTVWTDQLENPATASISEIAVATNAVYVIGYLNGSFLRKYDVNGKQVWEERFGNWSASSLSVTSTGIYIAGYNNTEYVVQNYYLNGTMAWSRLTGNRIGNIYVYSNPDGVYLTNQEAFATYVGSGDSLVQKYTLDGTFAWARDCKCDVTGISGDESSAYISGTVQRLGGLSDGFLSRYDARGIQLWNRSISAPGLNSAENIQLSIYSSDIYLTSPTSDEKGMVMRYDSNGNRLWGFQLPWKTGSNGLTSAQVAVTVSESGIYLGGTDVGSEDAFIARISRTSSLIFFGLNPPFSFGLLGLLVSISVSSTLLFRRQWIKTHRSPRVSRHRSISNPRENLLED